MLIINYIRYRNNRILYYIKKTTFIKKVKDQRLRNLNH